jgi:hypothetical protein
MKHGYSILGVLVPVRVRTSWVRTDNIPIFLIIFCNGYTRGTSVLHVWYTNLKKCNFFSFIRFLIYRNYVFYLFII